MSVFRAPHIPLPNGQGQVELSVWQKDLGKISTRFCLLFRKSPNFVSSTSKTICIHRVLVVILAVFVMYYTVSYWTWIYQKSAVLKFSDVPFTREVAHHMVTRAHLWRPIAGTHNISCLLFCYLISKGQDGTIEPSHEQNYTENLKFY